MTYIIANMFFCLMATVFGKGDWDWEALEDVGAGVDAGAGVDLMVDSFSKAQSHLF